MQILLMYVGEDAAFDEVRVRRSLGAISGISEVREEDVTACRLEAVFRHGDDVTIIRLSTNRETVSIHGTGPASRRFAIEFQRCYGEPLHLIDDGYAFDALLDGTQSEADCSASAET
jgi:hypothetical protein